MPRATFAYVRGPAEAAGFQAEARACFDRVAGARDQLADEPAALRMLGLANDAELFDERNLYAQRWPVYFWRDRCSRLVSEASRNYPLGSTRVTMSASALERPAYWPQEPLALNVFERGAGPVVRMSGRDFPLVALLWAIGVNLRTRTAWLRLRGFTRAYSEHGDLITVPIFVADGVPFEEVEPIPAPDQSAADMATFDAERLMLARWACTASMFIQQKVIGVEAPAWTARARAAARPDAIALESVKIVDLRALETVGSGSVAAGTAAVEWACQWVVRGHWRQQWFPSRRGHAPIWIHPHIKGPEDKPLHVPAETVFAVTR